MCYACVVIKLENLYKKKDKGRLLVILYAITQCSYITILVWLYSQNKMYADQTHSELPSLIVTHNNLQLDG